MKKSGLILLSVTALLSLQANQSLIDHYSTQITSNQANYVAHFHLAAELFAQGDIDGAIEHYRSALRVSDALPSAHFNLGVMLQKKDLKNEAYKEFLTTLAYNPDHHKARAYIIDYLEGKEKYAQAIEHCKIFLSQEPQNRDMLQRIANLYNLTSQFDESIMYYRKALLLDPKHGQTLLEYANTLNMAGNPEIAYEIYQAISDTGIKSLNVTYNIAYTLKKLGKYDESIELCKYILSVAPDYAPAHFALATSYLTLGNFSEGWKEYEWRWKQGMIAERLYKEPMWSGGDLHGKIIFIHAEQGLGDTFQFIRYARIAKEKGGYVVAAVQSQLVKLLSLCPYIDKTIPLGQQPAHFDVQVTMLSLPLVLDTQEGSIPDTHPYLFSDHELDVYWHDQIKNDHNFKIGICWQGNPNYNTHFLRIAVASKSLKPSFFAPVGKLKGVTLYSLQKEHAQTLDETLPEGFIIRTFGERFDRDHGRFMDTASLMKNLDLVITVDTSIAHLAGGLGIPVWVILPKPADWRWMLLRSDTPWYPTMRLFRQTVAGNWTMVIDEIVQELETLIKPGENDHDQCF